MQIKLWSFTDGLLLTDAEYAAIVEVGHRYAAAYAAAVELPWRDMFPTTLISSPTGPVPTHTENENLYDAN